MILFDMNNNASNLITIIFNLIEDTPLSVLQDMYRLSREDSDDDEFGGF
jgi:hypothetical protein